MATDFRSSPFDLIIENQYRDQATPVLYIVSADRADDASQHIRFRFVNKGNRDFVLKSLLTADALNYHFALVFRPSTIHYVSNEDIRDKFQIAIGEGWTVSAPISQPDSTEVIYFSAVKDWIIRSNDSLSFLVRGLSGAAATGSRSTQVQLLFREPVGDSSIIRVRNQYLDIVNHDGKTFAQLDFVVLGAATLVHRSMENMLRVQMIETNGREILVSKDTYIDFRIPFYMGDYNPDYHPAWVLGEQSKVNMIGCLEDNETRATFTTERTGKDVILGNWGFKNIRVRFNESRCFKSLIFRLEHVPADGPIGAARIKMTVSNLPGYWDSEFELTLEKTLLTTKHYDDGARNMARNYGMLNNQVVVGADLPKGWKMHDALSSSLSITSATIKDQYDKSAKITDLLRLHDDAKGMNGMTISVGNWQDTQDPQDPPKEDNPLLKDGYLIRADQYNHGTRFKVDFFGNIITAGRIKDQTGLVMPVGAILAYGGSAAPEGWLLCNGQPIDEARFSALQKVINAKTTPDLRSRFIVGAGQGYGLSNYLLGEQKGEEKHKLSVSEMPAHSHSYSRARWDTMSWKSGGRDPFWTDEEEKKYDNPVTETTGGNEAHNNLPPYYALTYIIKY